MKHMNRTLAIGTFAIATMFLVSGLGGIAYEGDTLLTSATLYAGQDIPVGTVWVSEDTDNIYVEFEITEEDWYITETHMDIQLDAGSFPVTKTGNPKVGHFAYSGEHEYASYVPYTIPKSSIEGWEDGFVVAAHAVVAYVDGSVIDFEQFSEHDFVSTVSTDCGDVDFYMTDSDDLVGLEVGDYVALTPSGLYPEVAAPDTSPPYQNIVAFTVVTPGNPYRDDWVKDDPYDTGAGGMVLTDPQDESQTALLWHAYSQYQAIVIDMTSVSGMYGVSLAGIDLDWNEVWHYLYFDADGYLIHEEIETLGPNDQSGDGVAFPITYDDPDIAMIAIYASNNLGERERAGYAIDNVVLSCVDDMETAWGAGTGFDGSSWATYIEWEPEA